MGGDRTLVHPSTVHIAPEILTRLTGGVHVLFVYAAAQGVLGWQQHGNQNKNRAPGSHRASFCKKSSMPMWRGPPGLLCRESSRHFWDCDRQEQPRLHLGAIPRSSAAIQLH